MRQISPAAILAIYAASSLPAVGQEAILPAGTALRIALDKPVRIHKGAALTAHLTEAVYLVDHQVIPEGSMVSGRITGTHRGSRSVHVRRLLAGDFTPPRIADTVFDSVTVPAQGLMAAQTIPVLAFGVQTSASVLTLGKRQPKRSVRGQVSDTISQIKSEATDLLKHHRLKETIEKWAVGQLPYHPEILWTNTRFNADLCTPAVMTDRAHTQLPIKNLLGQLPEGTLHARLISPLSSATAKRGDLVKAVTTQPLLSSDGQQVLVPEGTPLHGSVIQTKAARNFGRNGSLRFTFSKIDWSGDLAPANSAQIHGNVAASETAPGANVTIDEEGNIKANDTPAKYVEPALLAVLAAGSGPEPEHPGSSGVGSSTVASNGFGLIARVVSLGTRDPHVVQGFAYYALAKSIYYRLLAKGQEVEFDHDTELQIVLSER